MMLLLTTESSGCREMNRGSHGTTKLVNLCQKPFTDHVDCTSVYADDQPPDNLITAGPAARTRTRGFRVEHFVRPPVHLDFHFSLPVTVACVVIKPYLSEPDCAAALVVSGETSSRRSGDRDSQPIQLGRGTVRGERSILLLKNRVFERRIGKKIDLRNFSDVLGSRVVHSDTVEPVEESMKDVNNLKLLRLTVSYFSGPKPVSLEFVEVWGTLGTLVGGSFNQETRDKVLAALNKLENREKAARYDNAEDTSMAQPLKEGVSRHCHFYKPTPSANFSLETVDSSVGGGEEDQRDQRYLGTDPSTLQSRPCQSYSSSHSGNVQRNQSLGTVSGQSVEDKTVEYDSNNSSSSSSSSGCAGNCKKLKLSFITNLCSASGGSNPTTHPASTVESRSSATVNTDGIPERYLDEITCEIMLLPMLLPSGHFVDRSTLEKLHHTDSVYGRSPSDPFTGVAFSEGAEPQFSVELKQQIDFFLSKRRQSSTVQDISSCDFTQVGQTLGSAAEIARHLSSNKASGVGQKRKRDDYTTYGLEPLTKRGPLDTSAGATGEGLREKLGFPLMTGDWQKQKHFVENSLNFDCPLAREKEGLVSRERNEQDEGKDEQRRELVAVPGTSHSHEEELASSLDRELRDLLHN